MVRANSVNGIIIIFIPYTTDKSGNNLYWTSHIKDWRIQPSIDLLNGLQVPDNFFDPEETNP